MSTGKAVILSDEEQALQDGLENLVAQLGTEKDKRSSSVFVNSKRLSANGNEQELNAMYRTDWLSGKIVDIIPNDMTREWRSFIGDMKPDIIKIIEGEEERLGLRSAFNEAHKWARLYGTAFIIISVDDGQTPDKPLNINTIRKGSLRHIKVADRHRMNNADTVPTSNPLEANFGLPEFYRINESAVRIHHSRVIRFDGVKLPYEEFRRNNFYSDSVLDRLYEPATNLHTVSSAAASMVYEANVDVIKVKNLMQHLQTAEGENLLRKRFALAKQLKSFSNLLLLDTQEEYEIKNASFSGLPELLDRYSLMATAASDVPATRLLGSSASGLNATGEGDLKNYYDKVSADQVNEYKPKLDYFDEIMFASLGISDTEDFDYEFNSLFQMTPKEQSEVDLSNAQRDTIYLDQGVITEYMVAKELKQNNTYSNITDEDLDELEELDNELESDDDVNLGRDPEEQEEQEEEGEGDKNTEES